MALVAARSVVGEVKAKVWTLLYGYLMICVQMLLVLVLGYAELFKDDCGRWLV